VLGSAAWLGWALFLEAEPPPAEARAFTSSRQCQECHAQTYAEWETSWHAQSWTDPEVRKLSEDFSNTDCIDCHAPRPVFETGLGNRVLPRAVRRVEGVDCLTCHNRISHTILPPEDAVKKAFFSRLNEYLEEDYEYRWGHYAPYTELVGPCIRLKLRPDENMYGDHDLFVFTKGDGYGHIIQDETQITSTQVALQEANGTKPLSPESFLPSALKKKCARTLRNFLYSQVHNANLKPT